jgi:hypothetical protein
MDSLDFDRMLALRARAQAERLAHREYEPSSLGQEAVVGLALLGDFLCQQCGDAVLTIADRGRVCRECRLTAGC